MAQEVQLGCAKKVEGLFSFLEETQRLTDSTF
jgi:hypothetical protein